MTWIEMLWVQLWQVSLIAIAVTALGVTVRYRWPRLMYGLWILVLVKCIVPPLVRHPLAAATHLQQQSIDATAARRDPAVIATVNAVDDGSISDRNADRTIVDGLIPLASSPGRQNDITTASIAHSGPVGLDWIETNQPADPQRLIPESHSFDADRWIIWGTAVWFAGCVVYWSVLAIRMRQLRVRIAQTAVPASDRIDQQARSMSQRLGVTQRYTIQISEQVGSPCLLGIVNPTILIPNRLASRADFDEIMETVLAHELIHLRRHDLWLGGFQNIVLGLWWFHPAIWWASRQLSMQVELLCDQAVIEDLHYKPSLYARRLLCVIESAVTDSVAALPRSFAPSMSAFGRTQRRMERIMKMNPERKQAGRRMAGAIVLSASLLVLPGDFNSIAQDVSLPAPTTQGTSALANTTLMTNGPQASPPKDATIRVERYDFRSLVSTQMQLSKRSERAVRQSIEATLAMQMKDWDENTVQEPDPEMAWIGSELHLFGTDRQHSIAAAHHRQDPHSAQPQIAITSRFLKAKHATASQVFASIEVKWYAVPNSKSDPTLADDGENPNDRYESFQVEPAEFTRWKASSSQHISSHLPLLISFLDRQKMQALVTMFQEHQDASLEMAPKVTLFDAQNATIQSAGWRPFVTSVSWNEAEGAKAGIEVIRDGMEFHIMPHLLDREIVGLRFACEQSNVARVNHIDLPTPIKDTWLQSPQVMTKRIATDIHLRLGDTAVFAWIEPQPDGDAQVRMVALGCEVADYAGKFEQPLRTWLLPSDSESVAMQRGLVPLTHFPNPQSMSTRPDSVSSEWQPTPIDREIPWPNEINTALRKMGVRVTAAGLTGLQFHKDSVAVLDGDSIQIDFEDFDPLASGAQPLTIESTQMQATVTTDSVEFEFQRPLSISGTSMNAKADSGKFAFDISKQTNGDAGWYLMDISGNVHFAHDSDFQLSGDRMELKGNGWIVSGNAEVMIETGPGTEKRVQAQRIEMSEDLPVLIIERAIAQ